MLFEELFKKIVLLKEAADIENSIENLNDRIAKLRTKDINLNNKSLNKNVCILGWAFKKDTNDTRESAAIYVAKNLIKSNIYLNVYDPKVKESQIFFDMNYINGNDTCNREYVSVYNNPLDCIDKTNIIGILTEGDEFKDYDWEKIYKKMSKPAYIFDGRNILDREKLESIGFNYIGLGR